ncbi:alpha/beta hydrolase [Flavobacterium sp. NRK F10]|uniref:alpha/beta fold hydrolase n=1 Tax=Flavobacterium sp. NRK F10 TaxID=2954931 RepID=UPI002091A497|nr:alpha/beta hydrolase [Flavobacterium sp. NRK F10]MCO6176377.1 alpha/beta hydrolase [Flavobacterium sp. NRK F10]
MKHNKKSANTNIPKGILLTAKVLQKLSSDLTVKFAQKLFATPLKHKIPKREFEMEENTIQKLLKIPEIGKEVMVYEYGKSDKKVLLVHGWSGRGTQLVKIADALIDLGYQTISFDAPAHGKSSGSTTLMTDFIASVMEIEKHYGPFEFAIGHSLGGMTVLNSIKQGLQVKKAVIIGSGDSVTDILKDFIGKLKLKAIYVQKMKEAFENELNGDMESYSGYVAAEAVSVPVLVIHDKDDEDVPYRASENIVKHLKQGSLYLTEGLGHRKILGDKKVIETLLQFLAN